MTLWPKTIRQQMMSLLVIVLMVAQLITLVLLIGDRRMSTRNKTYTQALQVSVTHIQNLQNELPQRLPSGLRSNPELRGAFFVSAFNRAAEAKKPLPKVEAKFRALLEQANLSPLTIQVALRPKGPRKPKGRGHKPPGPPPHLNADRPRPDNARRYRPPGPRGRPGQAGPPQQGRPRAPGMQEIIISAEIKPNVWFNAMVPHYPVETLTPRIFLSTAILLLLTLVVAGYFVGKISKPYSKFAEAADRLGRGDTPVPLAEGGPEDIRKAAIAFNTMQDRLTRLIEGQRTMLRAVGHDLRTPLTAMRLEAEDMKEKTRRAKLINSIDDMAVITQEILDWSKDLSGMEARARVNLNSLLQSICDDYGEQNLDVGYEGSGAYIVNIRRVALKRALQNLINNAVQYGKSARVSVENRQYHVVIHIDDCGEGIPQDQLENVTQPFVRLESSRNKATGGTGLGLSIAKSVIETEGGKLVLSNRAKGGLRASVHIPANL